MPRGQRWSTSSTPDSTAWSLVRSPRAGVLGGWSCSCLHTTQCWTPGLVHPAISHLSPECQVLSPITCHLPVYLGGGTLSRSSLFHVQAVSMLTHPPAAKWCPELPQETRDGTGEGWKLGIPTPAQQVAWAPSQVNSHLLL